MTTRIVSEADLLKAVREELRLAGLVSEPREALPLPIDVDAEREVLSAILSGQMTPAELDDLEPKHFGLPLHAWVYTTARDILAAGLDLTPQLIVLAALDQGIAAGGLAEELDALSLEAWRTPADIRAHAATIKELYLRRELCLLLRTADLHLRAGTVTYERALRRLAEGVRT